MVSRGILLSIMKRWAVSFAALVAVGLPLAAQNGKKAEPAPPPPKGSVFGKVISGDTQRPAPFADVSLLRIPQEGEEGFWNYGADREKLKPVEILVSGRTGLDGAYALPDVPVGEYWVVAQSPGYILPLKTQTSVTENPKTYAERSHVVSDMMADLPRVHVEADRTSEMNLTMQRGAVVSGRVLLDDGSPLGGVTLKLTPVEGHDSAEMPTLMGLQQIAYKSRNFTTDDRGGYRISGVPPGKYYVAVSFQGGGNMHLVGTRGSYRYGPSGNVWLTFYAPGTVHKAGAQALEIKGAELANDVDIRLKLDAMHTISGTVIHKEDSGPVSSGTIVLNDDSDKEWQRYARIERNGEFKLEYVPEGTYTLHVRSAADVEPSKDITEPYNTKTLRRYADAKQSVVVVGHDMKLEAIGVEERKPKPKAEKGTKDDGDSE